VGVNNGESAQRTPQRKNVSGGHRVESFFTRPLDQGRTGRTYDPLGVAARAQPTRECQQRLLSPAKSPTAIYMDNGQPDIPSLTAGAVTG
jgi:hypothetical protein